MVVGYFESIANHAQLEGIILSSICFVYAGYQMIKMYRHLKSETEYVELKFKHAKDLLEIASNHLKAVLEKERELDELLSRHGKIVPTERQRRIAAKIKNIINSTDNKNEKEVAREILKKIPGIRK